MWHPCHVWWNFHFGGCDAEILRTLKVGHPIAQVSSHCWWYGWVIAPCSNYSSSLMMTAELQVANWWLRLLSWHCANWEQCMQAVSPAAEADLWQNTTPWLYPEYSSKWGWLDVVMIVFGTVSDFPYMIEVVCTDWPDFAGLDMPGVGAVPTTAWPRYAWMISARAGDGHTVRWADIIKSRGTGRRRRRARAGGW